jgi:hypothetical protein
MSEYNHCKTSFEVVTDYTIYEACPIIPIVRLRQFKGYMPNPVQTPVFHSIPNKNTSKQTFYFIISMYKIVIAMYIHYGIILG